MKKSLKKQVFGGLAWRGGTDVIQQVLQIGFTIILARLLTKGDFGLVAMALLVNRFVKTLTNIGFGTAIIQSQTVNKGQISAIFYIQLALNSILTILVYLGSGMAARFFEEPSLVPIIETLSIVIFLQTFQFPNILLQKKMDFKRFSIAEIISMIVANVIAVILAVLNFGVWALIWRLLIQRFAFGVLSFYYGKWLPSKPTFKGIKPLFSFGLNMLGNNIFYFFAENMIGLLTGKYLGKEIMGLFNIAYNLAIVPASKVKTILTMVLTSGFSQIQDQLKRFKTNYTKALRMTSLIFIPLMAGMAAVATNAIPVVYGEKWSEAGYYLMILAAVGLIRGLVHILRSALIAKGKANIIFKSAVVEFLTSMPLMVLLMPNYSIYGLMVGYLIGAFSSWFYVAYYYDRTLGERFLAVNSIKSPLLLGVLMFIPVFGINYLNFSAIVTLVLQLILGTGVFIWFALKYSPDIITLIQNRKKKQH
ncbi:lipopolysaccharide biosynthesis protein [Winogradskyella ouciana]|uniref:Oligosaccharide flippase family protein n=1 Tax=Winogradskyella ouciana TaxID=2608631 RepID=A0A7K1GBJ8_9FLAO|nr:lipopolysaccharide biosynthesis protein [Winogradskyella ouciana]MTE26533.1 oligosaccharide flippase family protein [Winogradskyella ouciana]